MSCERQTRSIVNSYACGSGGITCQRYQTGLNPLHSPFYSPETNSVNRTFFLFFLYFKMSPTNPKSDITVKSVTENGQEIDER